MLIPKRVSRKAWFKPKRVIPDLIPQKFLRFRRKSHEFDKTAKSQKF